MKKCTEIAKNGNKSLVEVRNMETGRITQYVVCSNFNNAKRFGTKWDNGAYFDVWNGATEEEMCKAAMMWLYDIKEPEIPYNRILQFAEAFFETEDAKSYMNVAPGDFKDEYGITKKEAEFFGIDDKLFEKLYKIVELTMRRTQETKIKVIMPDDEDECNAEDYAENLENLDDYDADEDDWECADYRTLREELTKEEYNRIYDGDEIWNDCDLYDGRI